MVGSEEEKQRAMTLPHALELLGLTEVPAHLESLLLWSIADLVARHGEEGIRQNKERLVGELEYLAKVRPQ